MQWQHQQLSCHPPYRQASPELNIWFVWQVESVLVKTPDDWISEKKELWRGTT